MSNVDEWFKSSFSGGANCVEVKLRDGVSVRDSKDQSGPVLHFTDLEWIAFVEGVRHGEFDLLLPPPAAPDPAN